MFTAALHCAGVTPSDAVIVGDSEVADIVPARKLGLRTLLVRPDERARVDEHLPDVTVADACAIDLHEAADILEHWSKGRVG